MVKIKDLSKNKNMYNPMLHEIHAAFSFYLGHFSCVKMIMENKTFLGDFIHVPVWALGSWSKQEVDIIFL